MSPTFNDSGTSNEVTIKEGEDAHLSCSATGTPPPTILWKREDFRLIRVGGRDHPGMIYGLSCHLAPGVSHLVIYSRFMGIEEQGLLSFLS